VVIAAQLSAQNVYSCRLMTEVNEVFGYKKSLALLADQELSMSAEAGSTKTSVVVTYSIAVPFQHNYIILPGVM